MIAAAQSSYATRQSAQTHEAGVRHMRGRTQLYRIKQRMHRCSLDAALPGSPQFSLRRRPLSGIDMPAPRQTLPNLPALAPVSSDWSPGHPHSPCYPSSLAPTHKAQSPKALANPKARGFTAWPRSPHSSGAGCPTASSLAQGQAPQLPAAPPNPTPSRPRGRHGSSLLTAPPSRPLRGPRA